MARSSLLPMSTTQHSLLLVGYRLQGVTCASKNGTCRFTVPVCCGGVRRRTAAGRVRPTAHGREWENTARSGLQGMTAGKKRGAAQQAQDALVHGLGSAVKAIFVH